MCDVCKCQYKVGEVVELKAAGTICSKCNKPLLTFPSTEKEIAALKEKITNLEELFKTCTEHNDATIKKLKAENKELTEILNHDDTALIRFFQFDSDVKELKREIKKLTEERDRLKDPVLTRTVNGVSESYPTSTLIKLQVFEIKKLQSQSTEQQKINKELREIIEDQAGDNPYTKLFRKMAKKIEFLRSALKSAEKKADDPTRWMVDRKKLRDLIVDGMANKSLMGGKAKENCASQIGEAIQSAEVVIRRDK